jgi:hypothetical protein
MSNSSLCPGLFIIGKIGALILGIVETDSGVIEFAEFGSVVVRTVEIGPSVIEFTEFGSVVVRTIEIGPGVISMSEIGTRVVTLVDVDPEVVAIATAIGRGVVTTSEMTANVDACSSITGSSITIIAVTGFCVVPYARNSTSKTKRESFREAEM